ncbi:MAG: AmmeMemoRadiSam system radical SAM enzyme [Deltaproteobacteria bacterium]|nr:MAG: AmmeMemoRadiSam system radical SAM enzyme [Deltaproteobacteria bacterium]
MDVPYQGRQDAYVGRYWHREGERVVCDLCPRRCRVKEGQRAFCFVRAVRDGQMVLDTYGRSTGFCIDPIEKKPLNHFHPGTPVLSFGTAGCNLGCRFCQNWDISKAREVDRLVERAMPEDIARAAKAAGCTSVAATYNDPVIFAEYAMDTFEACHAEGIRTVAVTAGYITPEARADFFRHVDAVNVDLKAFTEDFYHRLCFGHLQPVLDTLEWIAKETDVWLEVTTLLIPGENDSEEEIARAADWFVEHLGPDVPWHFSAFHPDFKMMDKPSTPVETLLRAREQAMDAGVHFVYCGNVHHPESDTTYCPSCKKALVVRDWYQILAYELTAEGTCPDCGTKIPGRFADRPGTWGRKRLPVRIS